MHRTGRTGRAGKAGTNLILSGKQELPFLKQCEESLKISIDYMNSIGGGDEKHQKTMEKEVQSLMETAH